MCHVPFDKSLSLYKKKAIPPILRVVMTSNLCYIKNTLPVFPRCSNVAR